jgi:hypothetical protein
MDDYPMQIPAVRFRPPAVAPTPAVAPVTPPAALAGDPAPGDVLTLAGGTLVRDANRNGFVDGADSTVRPDRLPWPSLHVDVRG